MFFPHGALRLTIFWACTSLSILGQMAPPGPLPSPLNTNGARIQFATPVHDLGKISSSSTVKYSYVFTNLGNARLEIFDVKTSCGCAISTNWSREVEPGRTGAIPVELNLTNVSGPVLKTVSVTCNDSNQPTVMLQLKATLWKPIDVNPLYAVFNLQADATNHDTKAVRIVNYTEQPLVLAAPESGHPSFSAEIKTLVSGKEFDLVISANPPFSGATLQAPVTVKTSSTNMPLISVNAIAIIQPTIACLPNQISLPSSPLPPQTKSGVTIRINGPIRVSITEPAVYLLENRPDGSPQTPSTKPIRGVDIRLQELQPGRFYNVLVTFPEDLEIRANERAELSLKTSHPRYPTLKIPIYQRARPTPSAAGAPSQAVVQTRPATPSSPANPTSGSPK